MVLVLVFDSDMTSDWGPGYSHFGEVAPVVVVALPQVRILELTLLVYLLHLIGRLMVLLLVQFFHHLLYH